MAIAYVGQVATLDNNFVTTTVDITVPAGGVAAGSRLILACVQNVQAATITVSDQKGNTWAVDATLPTGSVNTRLSIASAHIGTALVSGDWIRITVSTTTGIYAVLDQFSGILSASALDKAVIQESVYNTNPTTSGVTATTTLADELLYGAFGIEGTGYRYTIANSFIETKDVDTSFSRCILTGYKIVSATGAYEFSSAVATGTQTLAAICTYKNAVAVDLTLPDADVTTTGWTTTPLFSKLNDASDATVVQATAV